MEGTSGEMTPAPAAAPVGWRQGVPGSETGSLGTSVGVQRGGSKAGTAERAPNSRLESP